MDTIRAQLLSDLETELNMSIPIQTGAVALTINKNRFWIDFDEGKNYICTHFLVDEHLNGNSLTLRQLEALARLNAKCEILGSGSVGVHEQTNRLHYFCSTPLILAHAEIILSVIASIPLLRQEIRQELCIA